MSLPRPVFDYNRPVWQLTEHAQDYQSRADQNEHILITGATGSGKSSGPSASLIRQKMRDGSGALFLTVKPTDRDEILRIAKEEGRLSSCIVFDASKRWRINIIEYFLRLAAPMGGSIIDNVVYLFCQILSFMHSSGKAVEEVSDFWMKALRQLLGNVIFACYHAYGRITVTMIVRCILSTPIGAEQKNDPAFQQSSFCYQTLKILFEAPAIPASRREVEQCIEYFAKTLSDLDQRTRSNIIMTVSAELAPLLHEPLHTIFCTDTNIIPEVTFEGAIIILDMPTKIYEQAGLLFQLINKYVFQKAVERRPVNEFTRPVTLHVDEADTFFTPYDHNFLSTARSSCVSVIYVTQSIVALSARIGGRNAQDLTDAFVGNFQTKIFCATTDHRTAQWAAEMIGKGIQRRESSNWSQGKSTQESTGKNWSRGYQDGTNSGRNWSHGSSYTSSENGSSTTSSFSVGGSWGKSESFSSGTGSSYGHSEGQSASQGGGWSEQMDYMLQPAFFARGLRQGGPRNNYKVDAILLQGNRRFGRTGQCWTQVTFDQREAA